MAEISPIKKRILQFIDFASITKVDFCEKTGISYANLKGKSLKSEIGGNGIAEILSIFPEISAEWLLTGNGEMLKTEFTPGKLDTSSRKLIPFYDIETEAGTMQVSNMDVSDHPDELIDAGDWFRDADSAMRVHGDSMFPLYKSGSIVVMKEVRDKSLIIYGQDYVLITSEYRAIKRIQKSDKVGYWLACSVNEDTWEKGELAGRLIHEPFDVCIDSVYKLFRVLGNVSRTESSRVIYAKVTK